MEKHLKAYQASYAQCMASVNKLILAQEATKEKSNEITAIPVLLKLLGLKGNQGQGLLHKGVKRIFQVLKNQDLAVFLRTKAIL